MARNGKSIRGVTWGVAALIALSVTVAWCGGVTGGGEEVEAPAKAVPTDKPRRVDPPETAPGPESSDRPATLPEPVPAPQPIRGTAEFDPPLDDPSPVSQELLQRLPAPDELGKGGQPKEAGPLSEWVGPPPGLYRTPMDPPLGYTGPSGVLPRDVQTDNHFVPVEDCWRIGFPPWDRYGLGHPPVDDYPYVEGNRWDPFNLNVLKGDYPIIGQNTFLAITAESESLFEFHQVPIGTTPFESTERPRTYPFFGRPNQFLFQQFFALSVDLFHGDAAFKPVDWRVRLTPVFNINYLAGEELAVVSPDVRDGVDRGRTFVALQEWFFETKLADLGPNYDFVSVRVGSQPFTSDFRGFIFSDVNRAVRLFGTMDSNREQFNLAFFAQQEKDTNSGLNTFDDRRQRLVIANYYIQDFIFPGYTAQVSVHYNHDDATIKFDKNDFLVRPDPAGVFKPHTLDVAYLGWAGDGHINRLNINHALYWALGHDTLNPIANRSQDISAEMAALELSYDRDWIRFRSSVFWASGDRDPRNGHATGFDAIFDNPNFAGGDFSYWQRQAVRLLGLNLTSRGSLLADLRSNKLQGQSNFVNPGLFLLNFGTDFDITPKLRMIANCNLLWFDNTESLKTFTFQEHIERRIGTDLSLGLEYRPLLSNNIITRFGVATLIPGEGFRNLYGNLNNDGTQPLLSAFLEVILAY
jgi:hypothetical protein